MTVKLFRYIFILICVGALAACSGKSPKKDDLAPMAKPGTSGSSDAARTGGLDPNLGPGGVPLNPALQGQSPVSVELPAEKLIYFDYDRSEIRAADRTLLDAHGNYLSARPGVSVRLEGHADERGSREYNLALGERRALAVYRYLNILGVAESQMTTHSYGEEKALDTGHSEYSWQRNRRVEIIYLNGAQ